MTTIFSPLTRRTRKVFDGFFSYTPAEPGEVLMRQGEPGQEFIVFLDGRAEVEVDGQHVAVLTAGGFCGELALLPAISRTGGIRRGTVTVTRPSTLGVCGAADFDRLREQLPRVGGVILVQAYQLSLTD